MSCTDKEPTVGAGEAATGPPSGDALRGGAADPVCGRRATRSRLDAVFGDVLPAATRDDAPDGDDRQQTAARDDEMRRNVPPHHVARHD